ncbi:uncharacterized protein LOC128734837 [Sabethes cyaneus]|uniref:uncharacterized protein LOC128734837 n=1 Tax=Sabethes cyaneus TaxID=53552 RepID=UPI00237EC536|nr:uncharacterized protein LOC128734837 [Sabethes cyaneus]
MATLFTPIVQPDALLRRCPTVLRRPAPATARISAARVKRDLFGSGDKEESKKIFEREIAAHLKRVSNKWGFNFQTGQPMENHNQFQWERVPPTSAPCCFTRMVTLTSAAHTVPRSTAATTTREEDLLDRRAERENGINYNRARPLSPLLEDAACTTEATDCGEPERTYPLVLRGATSGSSSRSSSSAKSTQIQVKITDCFKERKRRSGGISKASPAKKARSMSPSATTSRTTATLLNNKPLTQ